MSKASAAQEPSMDEILASIRRIIETGEDRGGPSNGAGSTARPGVSRFGRSDPAVEPPAAAPSDEGRMAALPVAETAIQMPAVSSPGATPFEGWGGVVARPAYPMARPVEADRRTPSGAAAEAIIIPQRPVEPEDEDQLTAALESELAASWGQFEDGGPAGTAADPAPRQDDESREAESRAAPESLRQGAEIDGAGRSQDAASDDLAGDRQGFAEPESEEGETMRREPSMPERGSFEPANTDERDAAATAETGTSRSPLFQDDPSPLASQMTGTLVAASFDELAQAIRDGQLKSLETMAQDMLRPMLQEWLDDNLPRMVERLVREEIERMARGGRR